MSCSPSKQLGRLVSDWWLLALVHRMPGSFNSTRKAQISISSTLDEPFRKSIITQRDKLNGAHHGLFVVDAPLLSACSLKVLFFLDTTCFMPHLL